MKLLVTGAAWPTAIGDGVTIESAEIKHSIRFVVGGNAEIKIL